MPTADAITNIESRLCRLERSARKWRVLALSTWACVAGALLTGAAAKSSVLRTEELILVDGQGKPAAVVGLVSQAGKPALAIADGDGNVRLKLSLGSPGTSLTLQNIKGETIQTLPLE